MQCCNLHCVIFIPEIHFLMQPYLLIDCLVNKTRAQSTANSLHQTRET